jgi:hypothetical protein
MGTVLGETGDVVIPVGDGVLSSASLSSVLEESRDWLYGSVHVLDATRIGLEHGMSGRIHRVVVETARGGSQSLIVKQDGAAQVERELLFRRHCGHLVRGCIPDLFCGVTDDVAGRGVLVLEDIAPAEQGDVLHGCTQSQAEAVIRVLARLHGRSRGMVDDPGKASLPRWTVHSVEPERWRSRLDGAAKRFPGIVGLNVQRLLDLPEKVVYAGRVLSQAPAAWLQVDAHLDNTLFRPDGTVVLLDWCNAAIGPQVIDLARFLTEGVVAPTQPERATALLSVYAEELRRLGVEDVSVVELGSSFELALLPLLQGAIGWAGRNDLEPVTRTTAVCESFLRSMCGWVLGDESGSQHRSKAL